MRITERSRRLVVCAALLLGTALWTGAGLLVSGSELHRAPLVLVGPDVATSALVDRAESLDGPPFDAEGTESTGEAHRALRAGEAVAVVEVDLAGTHDTLTLPDARSPNRNDAVTELVESFETAYGRSIRVDVPDQQGPSAVQAALLAVLLGFVATVLITVARGAVARTLGHGLARIGGLLLLAALVSAACAPWASARTALTAGTTVLAAGVLTQAWESLFGVRGLLVAAALLFAVPLPLVVAGDSYLLAEPWASVGRWSLLGAAADGFGAGSGVAVFVRSAAVLVGTSALALVVLAVARYARGRGPDRSSPTTPAATVVRRQLVGLMAGAVALTVLVYSVWAGSLEPEGQSMPSLASSTECVPSGSVDTVADLNRITRLRGSARMRGGDVGASARLQDGRQIWMFGDTLRGRSVPGGQFVRNSMIVVAPGCLRVVVPDSGGAVIPGRSDGVGYWPMSVVVDSHRGYDLVTVTAQRVRTTDQEDVFGFESLGPSLVTYIVKPGTVPQYLSRTDLGPDRPDSNQPMWGAATARAGRWLYLYGTARPEDAAPGTGFSLRVARVAVDRMTDQSRWRYWDGAGWSRDEADAHELIGSEDGVSQTLSVFHRGGRWFAFSKRGEFLGQDLVFWTGPDPTGPFTAQPPVGQLPSDVARGTLRYLPLAHPDLLPRKGSMVVSYSENRTDADAVIADPLLYRPRFLRVPLPSS